jgi:hypothetical protein
MNRVQIFSNEISIWKRHIMASLLLKIFSTYSQSSVNHELIYRYYFRMNTQQRMIHPYCYSGNLYMTCWIKSECTTILRIVELWLISGFSSPMPTRETELYWFSYALRFHQSTVSRSARSIPRSRKISIHMDSFLSYYVTADIEFYS